MKSFHLTWFAGLLLAALWLSGCTDGVRFATLTTLPPSPTFTPLPPSATPIPTSTMLPSPTPTQILPTAVPPTPDGAIEAGVSPDGAWTVYERPNELLVIRSDGVVIWTLEIARFIDFGYLVDDYWSSDGQHLFFSVHKYIDGGWFPIVFGVHRLNLSTGQVDEILDGAAFNYAISADGRWLAYAKNQEKIIRVRDLSTGSESPYPVESRHGAVGSLSWSPDASILAFTAGTFVPGEGGSSELGLLRQPEGKPAFYFRDAHRLLSAGGWVSESILQIVDRGMPIGEYETNLGEFSPAPGVVDPPEIITGP